MGKLCCGSEPEEEAGFNLLGLLVAAVIALVFMLLCTTPRRCCVTIYPCEGELLKERREGKARQPLSGSEEELPRPQDARREKVRGGAEEQLPRPQDARREKVHGGAEQARYGSVPDLESCRSS